MREETGMEERKFTVEEALGEIGFGYFQILVLGYAGMGWVAEAMEMMLLSFVGPALESAWDLSPQQESLITSVVFAGMLVGAYTWGIVSDKHGRRKGFLTTAMLTATAGFFSALAPNYTLLIILRCFVGFGLGGGPVLSSWFLEFIPAPNRGTWMVVFSAFWTLGTIFEALLAWLVMPTLGWRWLLALSSLPSSLLLIFYWVVPESPRFLCLKGRTSEALTILENIARINGKELPLGVLVTDQHIELQENITPAEDMYLLSPIQSKEVAAKAKNSNAGAISSLLMLLSPELVRSTLLLWIVFFGNAFSYYGLVLLTSELNNGNSKCVPGALQSETSQSVSYRDVFITSFAELPGLVIAAATVDKFGRKFSMSSMFFLCCLFLFPLVIHQPKSLTTTFLFGARICITATFTVIYIYAPEIYPTSVRTTGVGIASSIGRIGGMICPLVAVGLIHGCHQTASIILFVIVSLVSGICVLLFPLETKDRELTDTVSSRKQMYSTA